MVEIYDFANQTGVVSALAPFCNDVDFLMRHTPLSDYDRRLLSSVSAQRRRLELLNVRHLVHAAGLHDLNITYADNGKPKVNKGFLSVSHSIDYVMVLWSNDVPFGIDIESMRRQLRRVSQRVFTAAELAFAGDDVRKLSLLWNCKEAVYKLADVRNLDYKNQISVHEFDANSLIISTLRLDNCVRVFCFRHGEIGDSTYVWGTACNAF